MEPQVRVSEAEHGAHQCRHGARGTPAAVTLYVTQTVGNGGCGENAVTGEVPDLAGILERLESLEARPAHVAPDVRGLVDAAVMAAENRVRAELLARVEAAVREMQDELRANMDEALARMQSATAVTAAPVTAAPAPVSLPAPAALPEPMSPVSRAPAWALRDLLSRSGEALPPEEPEARAAAPQAPPESAPEPTPEEALAAVRDRIETAALSILSRLCSDQIAWEAAMRARNGSSVALKLFEGEAGVLGIDPGALVERIISQRQANERRTMAVRAAYLRAWQAADAATAEQRRREMMEAGDG